ncbi:4Fe-4S binding protein [Desulfobacula sp.]|uniref:4Fe-4S binding protein n=1 Tax=Desulfobacula sp. TaxID=2593537 RepID=UPI00260C0D7A|nr:4Fe-4S binding protein [Desulfobacula sp.]
MNIEKTTLLYFSPTSTTRIILEEIARGMGKEALAVIDITKPEMRTQPAPEFGNDLVLMGAPVYGGRLPKDAAEYFKTVRASGSLAVLVVLYGNREFEDALLELKDIAVADGFSPLAAGAFIGEHSFSNNEFLIAANRPDEDDLEKAFSFGKQIARLLDHVQTLTDFSCVDVPGNFPYKDGMSMGPFSFIEITDDCDNCGICVTACPENAIDETRTYSTLEDLCIYCCACIKACPQQARILKDGPIKDKAKWLFETCARRKEPQIFLAEN